MKPYLLVFFFHHRNIMAIHHCTGMTKTPDTSVDILGKIPTDRNTDCILGRITSMWKITPPIGQITFFPIAHIFTGLAMLIPSPETFLRINLQLLMELVACFSTSI